MGLWITKRYEDRGKRIYWDIELTRGDSAYIVITLDDLQEQGIQLRDGDIVRCQVRTTRGQLVIDGSPTKQADGSLMWRIAPSETETLDIGAYVWDAEIELPDSDDVFTFVPESKFNLVRDVSRRED